MEGIEVNPQALKGIIQQVMTIFIFIQVTLGEEEQCPVVFPINAIEFFSLTHIRFLLLMKHGKCFEWQNYKKYFILHISNNKKMIFC